MAMVDVADVDGSSQFSADRVAANPQTKPMSEGWRPPGAQSAFIK